MRRPWLEGASTARKPPPGGPGLPRPARRRPPDRQMLGRKTDLPRRERSAVRVHHHGFGVVVGEGLIQPGLDDRLPRRAGGGRDAHTLFPQAEMAQDALA